MTTHHPTPPKRPGPQPPRDRDYYARIGSLGAATRWGPRRLAFDPGPPTGTHDDFCDQWREARARDELARTEAAP